MQPLHSIAHAHPCVSADLNLYVCRAVGVLVQDVQPKEGVKTEAKETRDEKDGAQYHTQQNSAVYKASHVIAKVAHLHLNPAITIYLHSVAKGHSQQR